MSVDALKAWINHGFTSDLLLIIPPHAPLSPNSRLTADKIGKAPGVPGVDGWVGFHQWPGHRTTLSELRGWLKVLNGAPFNVGLNARHLHAIDCDASNVEVARWLYTLLVETMPDALTEFGVRLGRPPHFLMPFRPAEPMRKMRSVFKSEEIKSAAEMLGTGQQYAVAGMHPIGRPYRWRRWSPGLTFDQVMEETNAG